MSARIREHIRSNAYGLIAIFIALGGTAYAANTVGSADIINESILSQDIQNGQVMSGDLANNQIRSADVRDDSLVDGGLLAADLAPNSVRGSELAPHVIADATRQVVASTPTDTTTPKEITVTCDKPGEAVTGGGFVTEPTITPGPDLLRSYAVTPNTWLVRVHMPGGADWQLTVVANCVH